MNLTNSAKVKKQKPAKSYTYFIHETQSGKNEGDVVVKRYGIPNPDDEIFASQKAPSKIRQQQQLYNQGLIGISDRTNIDYYAQTIELGRQGGLKSSRKIWTNEAEKQQAKRAKKKWLAGKELNDKEKALLIKAGLISKEPTKTKSKRTAAYKYHANRAASSKERKARWKSKQAQKKPFNKPRRKKLIDW